jgi:anti-anti-sigma factor
MSLQPICPSLRVEKTHDVTVVKLTTQDLEEAHIQPYFEELKGLTDCLVHPQLQLDLGAVRFLTSTAIGKFVSLHGRVRAAGGHLALVNLNELVYEIFEVSCLHRLLNLRRHGSEVQNAPLVSATLAS